MNIGAVENCASQLKHEAFGHNANSLRADRPSVPREPRTIFCFAVSCPSPSVVQPWISTVDSEPDVVFLSLLFFSFVSFFLRLNSPFVYSLSILDLFDGCFMVHAFEESLDLSGFERKKRLHPANYQDRTSH